MKELPRAWLSYLSLDTGLIANILRFFVCDAGAICKEAYANARSDRRAIESYRVLGMWIYYLGTTSTYPGLREFHRKTPNSICVTGTYPPACQVLVNPSPRAGQVAEMSSFHSFDTVIWWWLVGRHAAALGGSIAD
jgi:hypothetical protein